MLKDNNTNKFTLNILAVTGIVREKIMQENPHSSILELKTLGIVSKKEDITMKTLSEYLHISSPSTTEIINRLVEDKKLSRSTSNKDHRIIYLTITPLGKKTLEKHLSKASMTIDKLMNSLTDKQKNEFNKILEIIINKQKQHEHSA